MQNSSNIPAAPSLGAGSPVARRDFLLFSGTGLAVGGLWLAGCAKDSDSPANNNGLLDVGTGDVGVLNYAYALEQLEAAFYAQVMAGGYFARASVAEQAVFKDLKDHEEIHAAFFKNALGSAAIRDLVPDFSNIDFSERTTAESSSRLGVLNAARAFEDLGVAAYNGVGRYITNNAYLTLAGKIVSVEARHAAIIRELLAVNTFVGSDVVDTTTTGQEKSKKPQDVLTVANTFLAPGSRLSATRLAD